MTEFKEAAPTPKRPGRSSGRLSATIYDWLKMAGLWGLIAERWMTADKGNTPVLVRVGSIWVKTLAEHLLALHSAGVLPDALYEKMCEQLDIKAGESIDATGCASRAGFCFDQAARCHTKLEEIYSKSAPNFLPSAEAVYQIEKSRLKTAIAVKRAELRDLKERLREHEKANQIRLDTTAEVCFTHQATKEATGQP